MARATGYHLKWLDPLRRRAANPGARALNQTFDLGPVRHSLYDRVRASRSLNTCERVCGRQGPPWHGARAFAGRPVIRDSAAYRRGVRPGQASQRPALDCVTVDLGGGILDTVCD